MPLQNPGHFRSNKLKYNLRSYSESIIRFHAAGASSKETSQFVNISSTAGFLCDKVEANTRVCK